MASTSPLNLTIMLLGAAVIGVCIFSRWWGVLILIGLAPFYGFIRFVLEVSPVMVLIKEAIVILISVSWLLEDVFLKRIKLPRNPVLMPLGIFLFILVIQFLRTGTPMQSLFGLRVYITYLPLFYVMLTEKITDRKFKTVLFVMIITAMMTVAYGFWQWSVGIEGLRAFDLAKAGPNISAGGYLRVFSTYAGPEYFAANLILQMLLLFGLITASRGITAKTIYLVCIGLMVFMLATTLYRSMWVLAIIAAGAILVITRRYRYIIVMSLILFAIIQYSPPYIKERAGLTFSKEDESYQIRKELYLKTNVINVLENIIGYGVGSSMGGEAFVNRTGSRYSSRLLMGGSTESWLSSVTIELGVAGLLVYLWLMFAVIKMALLVYRESSELLWKGFGLGFSAFAIGDLVVSSFFLVPACFPAGDLYFWFLTAMMARKYHELYYNDSTEAISAG
ncbi:MAG: hypothetical protein Q7W05_12515 [Deltaproteobacteria bacterium]|nr:hypothetical protein [Deltaproteobacteria bacterium]